MQVNDSKESCKNCKHDTGREADEYYYCNRCKRAYTDEYEPKEDPMNDIEKAMTIEKAIAILKDGVNAKTREEQTEAKALAISALEKQLTNDWTPASTPPEEDGTYIVAWLPMGCKSLCDYPHYYGMFTLSDGKFEIDVPEAFKDREIIILAWQHLPLAFKAD